MTFSLPSPTSLLKLPIGLRLYLLTSQTFEVLSMEQDARKSPQECQEQPHTACVWSVKVKIHSALEKSHIFTVPSPDDVARRAPLWRNKKIAIHLSVNVFKNWGHCFYVYKCKRDRNFTWSSGIRRGLAVCCAKGVPSFPSYFKTLGIGPIPGIKPATSRFAGKCPTDWAYPTELIFLCSQALYRLSYSFPEFQWAIAFFKARFRSLKKEL